VAWRLQQHHWQRLQLWRWAHWGWPLVLLVSVLVLVGCQTSGVRPLHKARCSAAGSSAACSSTSNSSTTSSRH
jgi:hypothetical protein